MADSTKLIMICIAIVIVGFTLYMAKRIAMGMIREIERMEKEIEDQQCEG